MDEEKEQLLDKLDEAERKGYELLECLEDAADMASRIDGEEIRTCVAGQLEAYTIGNIRAFIDEDNDYQCGNLMNLRKIITRPPEEEDEC